jgi:hypothetical protein
MLGVFLIAIVAGELRGAPAFAHPITHRLLPLVRGCYPANVWAVSGVGAGGLLPRQGAGSPSNEQKARNASA